MDTVSRGSGELSGIVFGYLMGSNVEYVHFIFFQDVRSELLTFEVCGFSSKYLVVMFFLVRLIPLTCMFAE